MIDRREPFRRVTRLLGGNLEAGRDSWSENYVFGKQFSKIQKKRFRVFKKMNDKLFKIPLPFYHSYLFWNFSMVSVYIYSEVFFLLLVVRSSPSTVRHHPRTETKNGEAEQMFTEAVGQRP